MIEELSTLFEQSLSLEDLSSESIANINLTSNNMANPNNAVNLPILNQYISVIPQFDGDKNKLENFLSICDKFITRYYNSSDESFNDFLLLAITSKLTNEAQNLINSRPELNSWDLIKNALRINFGELRDRESLEQDLLTITLNRNENLIEFGERIKIARSKLNSKIRSDLDLDPATKLIYLNQYDSLALNAFIRNLKGEIRTIVRLRKPRTIEHAISLVIEEENFNYNINQNQNKQIQNIPKPFLKPHIPGFVNNSRDIAPRNYQIFQTPQHRIPNNVPQNIPPQFNRQFFNKPQFPSQPINIQPRQITQQHFPTNRQTFGPPQNVFKPSPNRQLGPVEPMSTQSRLSNPQTFQKQNPFRNFNPNHNQHRQWQSRELNHIDFQADNNNYSDYSNYDSDNRFIDNNYAYAFNQNTPEQDFTQFDYTANQENPVESGAENFQSDTATDNQT